MFVNLTNHNSSDWSINQMESASVFGDVVDIPFPLVAPTATEDEIDMLTDEYVDKILSICGKEKTVVHIMGEMTFTFALVTKLKKRNIICLASTTDRITSVSESSKKVSIFQFVKFRRY